MHDIAKLPPYTFLSSFTMPSVTRWVNHIRLQTTSGLAVQVSKSTAAMCITHFPASSVCKQQVSPTQEPLFRRVKSAPVSTGLCRQSLAHACNVCMRVDSAAHPIQPSSGGSTSSGAGSALDMGPSCANSPAGSCPAPASMSCAT